MRRAALRIALLALLAANTAVYCAVGTLNEALDSIAWLSLLVLFEAETGIVFSARLRRFTSGIRIVRLAAAAAVAWAMIGYIRGEEWLDAGNIALWCAVIALLELEVRRPDVLEKRRRLFVTAATTLYAGLMALVAVWLWRGEWFDAYDAALWLVAFALLEMDVLGITGPETRG